MFALSRIDAPSGLGHAGATVERPRVAGAAAARDAGHDGWSPRMTASRPRRLLAQASRSVRSARRAVLQRLLGLAGVSSAYTAGSVVAAEPAAPAMPNPRLSVTSFGAIPGTLDRPARD